MKIIEKILIRKVDGSSPIRRFYLFGFPTLQYTKPGKRRHWSIVREQALKPQPEQRIYYLKVNRTGRASNYCIQHWLDTAFFANAFIYFVCDNQQMKKNILKTCYFWNKNFCFIPSNRFKLKKLVRKLLGTNLGRWLNVGCSMLTPFYHAAKHNYAKTYNIDADDIEILCEPELIARAFEQAEQYADSKDLDCINLDMFVSRSFGTHWSFGVVYVRHPQHCLDVTAQNTDWHSQFISESYYKNIETNVDLLFTYLRDAKKLKLETFYIENACVVHMPDILLEYHWSFMQVWKNGRLTQPIKQIFYDDQLWGEVPICPGLFKTDVGLTEKDMYEWMRKFYGANYNDFMKMRITAALEMKLIDKKLYNHYMEIKEPAKPEKKAKKKVTKNTRNKKSKK